MGKLSTYPVVAPVDGDLVPFTSDPGGSPATSNMLIEAVAAYVKAKNSAYSGLYIADDGDGPQVITTTPAVIVGFHNVMATAGTGVVAAVHPANAMTVVEAGNYFITGSVSYTGENNKKYTVELFMNGVATGAHLVRTTANATDETGGGYAAIMTLPAGAVLDLRISSPTGIVATITDCQLLVERK